MNTTAETQTAVPDNLNGPRAFAPPGPPRAIITRDGERILRAELEHLRRELGSGMAERLREARAFGAPAANDEYLQIQEEEVVMAVRAARLDELLEKAEVVDGGPLDGRAAVGTIVDVKDVESGDREEHELVGGHEAPRANAASAASPIGEALIDRMVGATVDVQLPRGRARRLQILEIRSVDHRPPKKATTGSVELPGKSSGRDNAESLRRSPDRRPLGSPPEATLLIPSERSSDVQQRDRGSRR